MDQRTIVVAAGVALLSLASSAGPVRGQQRSAGAGPPAMEIRTTPPGVTFFAYSSTSVLFRGTTPGQIAAASAAVEKICFEKEGYETFWKSTNGAATVSVTLRPLSGAQTLPSSRCFQSDGQLIADRTHEEEEAARIAKKKREEEANWQRLDAAKAARAAVVWHGSQPATRQDRTPAAVYGETLYIPASSEPIAPEWRQHVVSGDVNSRPNAGASPRSPGHGPSGP